MDDLDRTILWLLDGNSRLPLADMSKHTGVSSQVIGYRIDKLARGGALKGCIATIDISRLGFLAFRFYARIHNNCRDRESEIVRSLVKHHHTLWVVSTSGTWDLEVVFVARNFIHFNNMLKEWRTAWGKTLSSINISMSPVSYRFRRDYLIGRRRTTFKATHYGFEPQRAEIDELDSRILGHVALNCRQSNEAIGRQVDVSYHTVASRLDSLKHQKVLQSYSVVLDLHRLNRKNIKILLWLEQLNDREEQAFLDFCVHHNTVIFVNEVLGDWQWELEAEVEDYDSIYRLLHDLRRSFPKQILNYQLLEITCEHKHAYAPHLIPAKNVRASKKGSLRK